MGQLFHVVKIGLFHLLPAFFLNPRKIRFCEKNRMRFFHESGLFRFCEKNLWFSFHEKQFSRISEKNSLKSFHNFRIIGIRVKLSVSHFRTTAFHREITYLEGHLPLHFAQSPQQEEPRVLRRTAMITATVSMTASTAIRMISAGFIQDLPCRQERLS